MSRRVSFGGSTSSPPSGESSAKGMQDLSKEIPSFLERASATAREMAKASQDCATELAAMEENYREALRKVNEHFEELAEQLQCRQEALLTQLDNMRLHKANVIESRQKQLAETSESIVADVRRARHAIEDRHADDVEHFVEKIKASPGFSDIVSAPHESLFPLLLDLEGDKTAINRMGYLESHPRVSGMLFKYISDFDNNGVLYWIGRSYGKAATYQNPADLGLVTVTASSCEFGRPDHAINHGSIKDGHLTFMSKSEKGSWLQLHLGVQYALCPTAYTLRNCLVNPCHSLKSWEFQGSNDGQQWTTLRKHDEDLGLLPSRGSVFTWSIEDCYTFYNRFRILMTGPNQHVQPHAKFYYLMLSGMELYGYVQKRM